MYLTLLLSLLGCFLPAFGPAQPLPQAQDTYLPTGWYFVSQDETGVPRRLDKEAQTYLLQPAPIVTAKNFTQLEIYKGRDSLYGLLMILDKRAARRWADATEQAIGAKIAFVVDNQLLYVAAVQARIAGGMTALNRGIYSKEELERFKAAILNKQ